MACNWASKTPPAVRLQVVAIASVESAFTMGSLGNLQKKESPEGLSRVAKEVGRNYSATCSLTVNSPVSRFSVP
jgi:hypothetical protein